MGFLWVSCFLQMFPYNSLTAAAWKKCVENKEPSKPEACTRGWPDNMKPSELNAWRRCPTIGPMVSISWAYPITSNSGGCGWWWWWWWLKIVCRPLKVNRTNPQPGTSVCEAGTNWCLGGRCLEMSWCQYQRDSLWSSGVKRLERTNVSKHTRSLT